MSVIWDQLALTEPQWTVDAPLWDTYREETRLVQLLMALRDEFESVRASILHESPLPTMDTAMTKLLTEDTRNGINPDINSVLLPLAPIILFIKEIQIYPNVIYLKFNVVIAKSMDTRNITAQSTTPIAADIQEMIHQALNMKNNDHLMKKQIETGRRVGRLYAVDKLHIPCSPITSLFAASTPTCTPFMSWHSRLGHISFSCLRYMFNKRLLDQSKIDKEPCCVTCRLAKQPALPFNNSTTSSSAPFDLMHSDIWGKAPISSMGGALYYVLFVDDYSRYTWIYILRSRSDFLKIYIEFSTMIQTQFSKTIKVFRSDSGGVYISTSFLDYLKSQGTTPQLSCPETPQQNGVVERKHRHIIETARSLLISSSVPSHFWGESIHTYVFIINRIPSLEISAGIGGVRGRDCVEISAEY
ncbi:unnamed protein product [Prunus armeniaca]|uniref:Integrase catalytic domain-containing protein n=1 Tax=Prunus armeniaca TaxID=36596 RepID=A0A6J5U9K1_PRUAR|nr:unnamed protein product [Prunus armeniaca]